MIKSKNEIQVGVVGAGTMGSGIAQVAAAAGHNVVLYDENIHATEKSKSIIEESLSKFRQKGKLSEPECESIFSRIYFSDQIKLLSECDFLIEAIVEDLPVKQKLFKTLEKIISAETILATNTSSLSVTSIAGNLNKQDRLIGTHFFNPPALLLLVEIIPTKNTSQKTIDLTRDLIESWGKATVICKDTPGFIVNRVARPFYLEALRILEEKIADIKTIDCAMKECGGFRMGPFELMDLIGNDINYKVTEMIYTQTQNNPRYEPSQIQKEMVQNNLLGRKTGKGFYVYNNSGNDMLTSEDKVLKEKIFNRIISVLINEAAEMVFNQTASAHDIDKAMVHGVNYPKGLLLWADELGIGKVIEEMQALRNHQKKERYGISPLLIKMNKSNEKFYKN